MIINSQLKTTLANLGLSEEEIENLRVKMMYTVTDIQARKTALEAQISTLQSQLLEVDAELQESLVTVNKLVEQENLV
jgi:hypothetical protein